MDREEYILRVGNDALSILRQAIEIKGCQELTLPPREPGAPSPRAREAFRGQGSPLVRNSEKPLVPVL